MLEITIHVKTPELADALRTLAGGLNIAHIPTMGITDDSIASAKTAPEQLALQTPAAPAAPVAPVMPAAPTAALVTPTAPDCRAGLHARTTEQRGRRLSR